MPETAIEVRNITKKFGVHTEHEVTALDDVSISIKDNEFFTLLGPSGCGKTTLLRLIAGFEYSTRGQILLYGENLIGLPPQKRPINTVFQHYALFPHMTVAENVAFPMKMLGKDDGETKKAVNEKLELVKMQDFANRKPGQLSGGQQQRIALARALAPHPKVLLLDEPLSALDLKLRQEMRTELKNLQRETGITFIFVTHDQVEALTMSDRIAVMSVGKIQQRGCPTEIYEKPNNRFVADFIGETNLLEATVSKVEGNDIFCKLSDNIILKGEGETGKNVGDPVTLAVRPEKIALSPISEQTEGSFTGKINNSIYLGTDTTYIISVNGKSELASVEQNSAVGKVRFKIGDEVCINVADNAIRILED
ncbi:MAG: ABC transporter ATP-binding protein [Desulfobacterales bacterium]|nr:ABC transporter ATP-binding protein [Desulfobacterales bacterium]